MPAEDAPGVDPVSPGMGPLQLVGEQDERFGLVVVTRYMKDDGRALLLYRHAEQR